MAPSLVLLCPFVHDPRGVDHQARPYCNPLFDKLRGRRVGLHVFCKQKECSADRLDVVGKSEN